MGGHGAVIVRRASTRYANVASTLALVVAFGGTGAFAASKVTSRDIGHGQVKRVNLSADAVTSWKVRNRSLLARDVQPASRQRASDTEIGDPGAAGPQGPGGERGDTGAKGSAGDTGATGPGELPMPAVLPSGRTLRGAYAFSGYRSGRPTPLPHDNGEANGVISFPVPLPSVPQIGLVRRRQPQNEEGAPTAQCPGSVLDPRAAPGWVCVYESRLSDNVGLEAFSPETDTTNVASRFGIGLFIRGPQGGTSTHRTSKGTWAVTAP